MRPLKTNLSRLLVVLVMMLVSLFGASAFAAATPAPRWIVSAYAAPTNFAPNTSGKTILHVQAHNVGAGATVGTGNIVLADALPAGLTDTSPPTGKATFAHHESLGCKIKAGVPTCTWKQATQGTVPTDGTLTMEFPVDVGAIAEGMLTDTAKVTGGYEEAGKEAEASTSIQAPISSTDAAFGLDTFTFAATDPTGLPEVQAGAHPYAVTANLNLSTWLPHWIAPHLQVPDGEVRDLVTDLPLGLLGNPQAVPRCPESDLANPAGATCPASTQVGIFTLRTNGDDALNLPGGPEVPVYNMEPSQGYPAELGFSGDDQPVLLFATLRPGDYGIRVVASGMTRTLAVTGGELTVWGAPSDAIHNAQRAAPASCGLPGHSNECVFGEPFPPNIPPRAFLTGPADCSDSPGPAALAVDSWHTPASVPLYPEGSPSEGARNFALADLNEPEWVSKQAAQPSVSGCGALVFNPSLSLAPDTSRADSPAGVHVDLAVPQDEEPEGLATPPLRAAVVRLPRGLVVDPSSADGLAGCSAEEVGVGSTEVARCPRASQIGTVVVETPLLAKSLPGEVFLGMPECAPCSSRDAEAGRLIKLYIQVNDPERGVVVKLAGRVSADPVTGALVATFDQNPQLPFSDLKVDFYTGERAALSTPATCGHYTTASTLTPWSDPETPSALSSSGFDVTEGAGGGRCVSSEGEQPNNPGFQAGSVLPSAGAYTPFVLKLTRQDGSQTFTGLNVTLPPGLVGKIAGVTQCSQASIETAEHNSGRAEQSTPSCPASSEVGTVDVGAGSGAPFHVQGHAYLAGPYKGAPFSLAIVTPAVAGPFDLGTVVVRSALYIDPVTARVTVKSDPIPTILDGIPLDIRSIVVSIDRSQFTLNPTSCERFTITGTAITPVSQAVLSSPFQVGGCAGLMFKPSFTAFTSGKTSKANGASLTVKVSQKPGEANIHKVDLQLPLVLPARLTTLQKACTDAQFNMNPAGCPQASNIGTAIAHTPLLNAPLVGPAYLVSHGGAAFPDVEFVLQGEGVQIVLDGGTNIKKGITYSKFETVPDAPISSFETILPEGPYSALAANANLCATTKTVTVKKRVTVRGKGHRRRSVLHTVSTRVLAPLTMPTTIVAQNGATLTQSTRIAVTGCPKAKPAKKHATKKKAKKK